MQRDKSAACVNKRRGAFSVKQALNLEATPKSSQKALQTSTQVLPVSRRATDEKDLYPFLSIIKLQSCFFFQGKAFTAGKKRRQLVKIAIRSEDLTMGGSQYM